jgi:Cu(I)/Ag(I) efflux system membrane fusion protein
MSTPTPSTHSLSSRPPRRPIATLVFALALVAAALVFREPLLAWLAGPTPSHAPAAPSTGDIDHYTCTMHPSVHESHPGKCPICGMELVPVTKQSQAEGIVRIDDAHRQTIGVRTEKVTLAPLRSSVRAIGKVTYDERALTDVTLKVRGYITQLFVNATGQRVVRGQTLFTIYSPDLFAAQQDFLLATHGPSVAFAPDAGAALASAARQRLHLLGMSDAQIDSLAKKGAPMESVAFASPASGFVIEKNVVDGASVDAGMRVFRIAALRDVWIDADVYEADLARVRVGSTAKVTLDYLASATYDAKVAYVYPLVDPKTRAGRVRVELANGKDLELRPGMFANVDLGADLGARLQVPTSAVVYTGPRRLVFVDLGDGRFKPTEVTLGAEANGMFEVLAGLAEGDAVATSGVFLIAAEARIATATKYWDAP